MQLPCSAAWHADLPMILLKPSAMRLALCASSLAKIVTRPGAALDPSDFGCLLKSIVCFDVDKILPEGRYAEPQPAYWPP